MIPAKLVRVFSRLRDLHYDLSINQAMILFHVAANPGISQRELYTTLGIHNSAASRALAVLSNTGCRNTPPLNLVHVEMREDDRRARYLSLTSKGERLVTDIVRDLS